MERKSCVYLGHGASSRPLCWTGRWRICRRIHRLALGLLDLGDYGKTIQTRGAGYGTDTLQGGVLGAVGLLLMRETYAPTLLERKAKRLRKETGNQSLRTKMDTRSHERVKLAIVRPIKFLLKTPTVTMIALYVGIAYGILNLLIATFSFVYANQYNFSEGKLGLSFLPAGIGMMIGVVSYGNLADYLVKRAQKDQEPGTAYRPEVKLTPWATVPVGLLFCAGMFVYGWTTGKQVHWIVPMLAVAVLSFGLMGATVGSSNTRAYIDVTANLVVR